MRGPRVSGSALPDIPMPRPPVRTWTPRSQRDDPTPERAAALHLVVEAARVELLAAEATQRAVALARETGCTWHAIGQAQGLAGAQGAQYRYRRTMAVVQAVEQQP